MKRSFATTLEAEIQKSGKQKTAIARAAGMSAAYLSHLLSGFREATAKQLAQLLIAIEDPLARQRLIHAFLCDAIVSVHNQAKVRKASTNLLNELEALLTLDLKDLASVKYPTGNLPKQEAEEILRVIHRAEHDAVFRALLTEILMVLVKLPELTSRTK